MSKYLSIDLEATGLEQDAKIIEFAAVAIDTDGYKIHEKLKMHCFVQCPSFDELKPTLNPWVVKNNEQLIRKAHTHGLSLNNFKNQLNSFLTDPSIKKFFNNERPTLFGKSLSAIDLPFLNRDLGWDWMNENFHHRNLDLSCYCKGLIDMRLLEDGMDSGDKLMKRLNMGEVNHTALEDAINTAKMYFSLLREFSD